MPTHSANRHYIMINSARVTYVAASIPIHIVVFLGVGQTGKNLSRISKALPDNVATVAAFPYHRFNNKQMDVQSIQSVLKIIDSLGMKKYHVIAESQAAPAVVVAAQQHPEYFRSVTLLEPLGFNKAALGDTPAARYCTLMKRSRLFWKHPNQSLRLAGNRITLGEILKHSLPSLRRIRPDYTVGASQDVSREAIQLAQKIPVTMYAAEHDSLFPYHEIAPTIKGSRIKLIKGEGGTHRNRATPRGLDELRNVIVSLGS